MNLPDEQSIPMTAPKIFERLLAHPLVSDAASRKPKTLKRVTAAFLILMPLSSIPTLLAWLMQWRLIGTVMLMLSLLVWALALIAIPLIGAARVTRTLSDVAEGRESFPSIGAAQIARGLTWRSLFLARWPLCVALAFLPALLISIFRLDLANFTIWQSSALTLGSAADPASTALLLPGGGIPLFRLTLRMLSLAVLLPLLAYFAAAAGSLSAFFRPEPGRAMLIGMLIALLTAVMLLASWNEFSLLPSFAGWAEGLRLLLVGFFLACFYLLIEGINRVITRQLGE